MSDAERVVVIGGGPAGLSTAARSAASRGRCARPRPLGARRRELGRALRAPSSPHDPPLLRPRAPRHPARTRATSRRTSTRSTSPSTRERSACGSLSRRRCRPIRARDALGGRDGTAGRFARRRGRGDRPLRRAARSPAGRGRRQFQGRLLHSAEYRSGREFAGLRALVVGLGNSGAEIATDLVEQGAASVSVAVRTPPPIVTREMFGVDAGAALRDRAHAAAHPARRRSRRRRAAQASRSATSVPTASRACSLGPVHGAASRGHRRRLPRRAQGRSRDVRPAVERLTASGVALRGRLRARTSTSSCSRRGSAPGSTRCSATYRESSASRRPAARPLRPADRRARPLLHRVRRDHPRAPLRGAARVQAARPDHRASSSATRVRNVQRLKRTNATGVTASSDRAWASVSSSPAPRRARARTAAFSATTTRPTSR